MEGQGLQDEYILDRVVDPATPEFAELMRKLMAPVADGRSRQDKLSGKGEFRYVLPFKGEPTADRWIMDSTPFVSSERAYFKNGVVSAAASYAQLVDAIVAVSGKGRVTPTLVVTADPDELQTVLSSAGSLAPFVHYCGFDNVADALVAVKPESLIFDHTTVNCPVDKLLNLAYVAGVQVVDGVFPYHSSTVHRRDVVTAHARWAYTHVAGGLSVGPDDDSTRMLYYPWADYRGFTEPALWTGNSRSYGYEIRKYKHGLCTYRAIYSGQPDVVLSEKLSFKLPLTSSDELCLITINKALASGVFSSRSATAVDLASLDKDYSIEVRRELVVTCIGYLVAQSKGSDIVGDAVRYINQHNYVDLVDGIRIVRCHSLGYADALCVAMVCALTAFSLRYRLTSESIPDIKRAVSSAKMLVDAPLGALGRLAWLLGTYVSDAVGKVSSRTTSAALHRLYDGDYIPGICYDLYLDRYYVAQADWFSVSSLHAEIPAEQAELPREDPFTQFLGSGAKTSAPTMLPDTSAAAESTKLQLKDHPYVPNVVTDPIPVLQHVYDQAFPGNSTAMIQNAGELRRVRDVNINTEFYGRVEINKDVAAPERLHSDAAVRTAALPPSRTPLLDAVMASAKRNFNPPDLQVQSNCFQYARYLVDKFKEHFFIPGYKRVLKGYQLSPITFNVVDYLDWWASRDGSYRSALEAECPAELVELNLERYDTIVKQRIKPKLSVSAQHELSQPQVIVSMSKKDTALFTSLFRVVFVRFEALLRPGIFSAGRASDSDISDWLTKYMPYILSLKAVELDSSKYDKSQNLLARMIESVLYTDLGLDPGVMEIFSDSYVGKVSSRNLGLMFISAYQMKSGAPNTMIGNSIYNAVSAGESLGWANVLLMIFKGDDNIAWLRELAKPDLVVAKMSGLFNLEVKMVLDSVLYFSSGYVVPVENKLLFAPDPLKLVELLGEVGGDDVTLGERHVSFSDRVASLGCHHSLPRVLQSLVRARVGVPELDVVGLVDALSAVAGDFSAFKRIKGS